MMIPHNNISEFIFITCIKAKRSQLSSNKKSLQKCSRRVVCLLLLLSRSKYLCLCIAYESRKGEKLEKIPVMHWRMQYDPKLGHHAWLLAISGNGSAINEIHIDKCKERRTDGDRKKYFFKNKVMLCQSDHSICFMGERKTEKF